MQTLLQETAVLCARMMWGQEEAEKFKEIHTDFGVIGFYDAKKLEADTGPLHLPNSLLA